MTVIFRVFRSTGCGVEVKCENLNLFRSLLRPNFEGCIVVVIVIVAVLLFLLLLPCLLMSFFFCCYCHCITAQLASLVRKVNSAIHRIVIFQTFQTCSATGKTDIKVQHCRVEVTFYPLQVEYAWRHCFSCPSVPLKKSLFGG